MTAETLKYLRENILIGYTEKRGRAWWSRKVDENGGPANHFPGAIPLEVVLERQYGWEFETVKVWTGDDSAHSEEAKGWQAIRRSDTHHVFAFPTDGYRIHGRREWCLDMVSSVLDTSADTLGIAGAGTLKGGAVCYVQFEMPENIKAANGEELRPFLLAATSGDGSLRSTMKVCITRVQCDNTLASGLAEKGNVFRVKHMANSDVKLSKVRDALGVLHDAGEAFVQEMDQLMNTPVSDSEWDRIVAEMIPALRKPPTPRALVIAENKATKIRQLYGYDVRVAPWQGTAWGVAQAFSTYSQHEGTMRGVAARAERIMLNAIGSELETSDAKVRQVIGKVLAR